jgi:hypothetical protein
MNAKIDAKIAILTVALLLGILVSGNNASAQFSIPNPLRGECDNVSCVLRAIANFLLTIAIPILTIMVLWAGYLFLTSAGSEEKIRDARKALLWAVIGFAIVLINWGFASIVQEILGGGRGGGRGGGSGGGFF